MTRRRRYMLPPLLGLLVACGVGVFLTLWLWPKPLQRVTWPLEEHTFATIFEAQFRPSDYLFWDNTAHPRYILISEVQNNMGKPWRTSLPLGGYTMPLRILRVYDMMTGEIRGSFSRHALETLTYWMPDGRLYCIDTLADSSRDGLKPETSKTLFRIFDPQTGEGHDVAMRPGFQFAISDDCQTLAVLHQGKDRNLQIEILDATTGTTRKMLTFPDRRGLISQQEYRSPGEPSEAAASGWALSPDGKILALSEGWNRQTRITEPGVELYDVETGELIRRLANYPAATVYPNSPHGPMLPQPIAVDQLRFTKNREIRGKLKERFVNGSHSEMWAGGLGTRYWGLGGWNLDTGEFHTDFSDNYDPVIKQNRFRCDDKGHDAYQEGSDFMMLIKHPQSDSFFHYDKQNAAKKPIWERYDQEIVEILDSQGMDVLEYLNAELIRCGTPLNRYIRHAGFQPPRDPASIHNKVAVTASGVALQVHLTGQASAVTPVPIWLTWLPPMVQAWWSGKPRVTLAKHYWWDSDKRTFREFRPITTEDQFYVRSGFDYRDHRVVILASGKNSATLEVWSTPPTKDIDPAFVATASLAAGALFVFAIIFRRCLSRRTPGANT